MIPRNPTTPIPIGTDCCVVPDVALGPVLSPLPPYKRFEWDPVVPGGPLLRAPR